MKRFLSLLFVFVFIPVFCLANLPDLSCLSFDDLVALRDQINLAMWNSQEWQEVTVPSGTYRIGEDIPAGHWTLRVAASNDHFCVVYFDKIDETGKSYSVDCDYLYSEIIYSSGYYLEGKIPVTEIDLDMKDGWYIELDGATVFTPYAGKPNLGFK